MLINKTIKIAYFILLLSVLKYDVCFGSSVEADTTGLRGAIESAICDYYQTIKSSNQDLYVVHLNRLDSLEGFWLITISTPANNVYQLDVDDSIGSISKSLIPTNYILHCNKLFVWVDKWTPINIETIKILEERNLIDSSYLKYEQGIITYDSMMKVSPYAIHIDELKKYTYYLINRKDIRRFKKGSYNRWPARERLLKLRWRKFKSHKCV